MPILLLEGWMVAGVSRGLVIMAEWGKQWAVGSGQWAVGSGRCAVSGGRWRLAGGIGAGRASSLSCLVKNLGVEPSLQSGFIRDEDAAFHHAVAIHGVVALREDLASVPFDQRPAVRAGNSLALA